MQLLFHRVRHIHCNANIMADFQANYYMAKQTRMLIHKVRYIPGKANTVADL